MPRAAASVLPKPRGARAEISRHVQRYRARMRADAGAAPGFRAGFSGEGLSALRRCCRCRWSAGGFTARSARPTCRHSRWQLARHRPAGSRVDQLIARAEAHLQQSPEDGAAGTCWRPFTCPRIGRYSSVVAYRRSCIQFSGATAARRSGLGEAIAAVAAGRHPDAAASSGRSGGPQHPVAILPRRRWRSRTVLPKP
jgi:cytochrome c-type biogenesis protein CcmH